MIIETSYAQTTPNLNVLLDRVVNNREIYTSKVKVVRMLL
jgi:hypothetical protein